MSIVRVTDPDDDRLADYRRLNDPATRRRAERDELFIAEGYAAIERLLQSGHALRSVLLTRSRVARMEPLLPALEQAGVPVYVVDREVLAGTVGFDLHRGLVAAANRRPLPTLHEVATGARRLVVLEGLNDAENVGLIARASRAFGLDGMVLDPTCSDPYSRRSIRVSMGEILLLPVCRVSPTEWPHALDALADEGVTTWAMTPDRSATNMWELEVPGRLAILLGAEGPGLGRSSLERAAARVRIPIRDDVDSLNVAQAAAVAFAVTTRRRQP